MLRVVDGTADTAIVDATDSVAAKMGVAFPIASGLVVAAISVAIYMNVGQPGTNDLPLATRTDLQAGAQSTASGSPDGPAMIAQLRKRLAADPNDMAGWVTLARTHRVMGNHREAVAAFEKALGLAGKGATADLISDYGETLVFEAFGTVSPRAAETFQQALALDPSDVKARFYTATSRSQAGDYRGAIAMWRGMTADAPADAPWVEVVRERITDAAMKGSIMPMSVAPERPGPSGLRGAIAGDAQPTQGDVEAVQEMAPADRTAFIRTMVQRLADKMDANPNDVDGWLRLGRAYSILGETPNAKKAFGRAKERLEVLLANTPEDSPSRFGVEETLREVEGLIAQ
jgi:cytochrome c-type biogenesis protein CcmH